MKISGDATLNAPVERVWEALLDPQVLVGTIPGCESLAATGENAYAMTVTAGVASIRGTYTGACQLSDLDPHSSLVMRLSGAGAPGTIDATVNVRFDGSDDSGGGSTTITYDAEAIVGGMVGGVGQRMLTSVSRRMAGEFFGNVDKVLSGAGVPTQQPAPPSTAAEPGAAAPATGQVFTAPTRAAGGDTTEFLKGVAVGAGLVVLGVVVGSVFGRRR
ncbi:carbon monoxide dehydrogenase subunit G [Nocardioides sp.]|uniref:SRPBCC family protein n=1 Tax=Nocardioides sp. TaxID=35761 RepID=UPI0027330878|nr:carbon monoxide dehydrogenase subunit G [Nocardioides sp.]MDP3892367.1 carbon monoxide dehydrogenase subunit G [Nocardioides sp.]